MILKMSHKNWLDIGRQAGWLKKANLLESLRTMTGKETNVDVKKVMDEVSRIEGMQFGKDPTTEKQWFDGFLTRITDTSNNIDLDLNSLNALPEKDPYTIDVENMLRDLKQKITAKLPQVRQIQDRLATELSTYTNATQAAETAQSVYSRGYGMNQPLPSAPAVPSM